MILGLKKKTQICFLLLFSSQLIYSMSAFRFIDQKGYIKEGESSIKVLDKALTYVKEHPESVVEDMVFGILIAKANLQWVNTRLKSFGENKYLWHEKVNELMGKCNDIINVSNKRNRSALNNELWLDEAENLKPGHLQANHPHFHLPNFNSCQAINDYMMNGSPDDSDFCIEELFTNNCNISDYCYFSEFNNKTHTGYKTTHRLIYFQIAKKVGCERKNADKFSGVEGTKKSLCEEMFREARALHESRHFPLMRDLFMEQISLCGFEGYEEFAPAAWRREVQSWQNEEGCFGADMKFDNCLLNFSRPKKRRTKRTDFTIKKCHTHVTAVAISAIAFHLRVILSRIISI